MGRLRGNKSRGQNGHDGGKVRMIRYSHTKGVTLRYSETHSDAIDTETWNIRGLELGNLNAHICSRTSCIISDEIPHRGA